MKELYLTFLITIAVILIKDTNAQIQIDTTTTENHNFIIKQSDEDKLWFELFHIKDKTIPKEVNCTYVRKAGLLIFKEMNTAYNWNDLEKYAQELIKQST